jgi:hypothetical protein
LKALLSRFNILYCHDAMYPLSAFRLTSLL